jgi:2-keto-4-pentenoate hydratase/2-oxohepta-3-ene-1,7-dioic acid hydratase in catechol pathway
MKIIRFQSRGGEIHWGEVGSATDGVARLIEEDIFGEFHVTEKTTTVKKLLAPVQPPNILALGLNYRKHAAETGVPLPDGPVLFLKATSSVVGPGEPILLPSAGPGEVDAEAELGIVIGRRVKNVPPAGALDAVLGYTCANDVSARDWQIRRQKKQWARGKSFDTFCPVGPCLVTRDEIPDPGNLRIRMLVNGEVWQDASTSDMIFDAATLIADLSRSMTLLPGTLILTGTPEGVGFARTPPRYLAAGDTVTVSIEGIGQLTNPVQGEP